VLLGFIDNHLKQTYEKVTIIWIGDCLYDKHIACGQSRAKKKEILLIARQLKWNSLKQIHLWHTKKAYGYVIFLTWVRVGLS
jgi:hypothetical protein